MKSNRFVIRKSLIGKNEVITFVNKKGETVKFEKFIDKLYNANELFC